MANVDVCEFSLHVRVKYMYAYLYGRMINGGEVSLPLSEY